jgi:hemoglobin
MNLQIKLEKPDEHQEPKTTIYELVGGQETFFRLVTRFYSGVEKDPILRPMYPENLEESIRWTALFLIQFCGGPAEYSEKKGHPRLRMRHLPFKIGVAERDAWVYHMKNAVESEITNSAAKEFLNTYFERTATFLINTD